MARFIANGVTPINVLASPIGGIVPFGGTVSTIPSGWLPCDGSVVSQTTYSNLFAAIGITWDIGGEGGGNFRLPDLRARSISGINDSTLPEGADEGFTTREAADTAGTEATPSEGSHGHTITHTHNYSGTTDSHTPTGADFTGGGDPSTLAHSHTITNQTTNGTNTPNSGNDGNHSHAIVPPTTFMPCIIKV